jgi:hypothetical protein
MTSEFRRLQDIEDARKVEHQIHAHRAKAFDFGSLNATTRRILRHGGISISASSTVTGMTVSEVDKIIEAYFKDQPSISRIKEAAAVKLDLMANGVLLPVNA